MSPKVTDDYKNDKIQFILKAAEAVFIRKGFYETTMKDIVDECEISRGGLYRYFSSTEEIFLRILDNDTEQDENFINQFIDNGFSAMQIFEAILEEQKNSVSHMWETIIPASYEFYIRNMRNSSNNADILFKRRDNALNILCQVIDYGISSKEFAAETATDEIALYIINFFEGLIVNTISVGIDEKHLNTQIDIFKDFLKRYLLNNSR